jgi:hypothetical protein
MVGVLLTWLVAWRVEVAADQHLDLVVLATVLAVTLSRLLARDGIGGAGRHGPWLLARLVLLPVIAMAATEVGRLLTTDRWFGGAVFVAVLGGSVWARRFGTVGARIGTLVTLPFLTLLVVPVPVTPGEARTLWPAAMALLALVIVTTVYLVAWWLRVVPMPAHVASAPAPSAQRLPASTRMAVQLWVGLAVSYAVGRWLFPDHWTWIVMSCFVVCAGNRGRGDVVHKGVMRLAGALAGTASATLLSDSFAPGDRTAIVALFVVMALAIWLREASYAFWAAGVTAMLALLYGYFGIGGVGQLGERLVGVLAGCVIAVVASWWVLPVRTTDVFRRRFRDARDALDELRAARESRPDDIPAARAAFVRAVAQLEQLEPALRLAQRAGRPHRVGEHRALDLLGRMQAARDRVL